MFFFLSMVTVTTISVTKKSAKKLLEKNSRLFEESENDNGEVNYLFYVTLACEDEQQQAHKVIF